jgi:molybdopterin converting factor small subunit
MNNATPSRDEIELTIELFGAFRQYTKERNLEIHLPCGASLSDLRKELEHALLQLSPASAPSAIQSLIEASAFADESSIMSETLRFDRDMTIAVLPPVCGG